MFEIKCCTHFKGCHRKGKVHSSSGGWAASASVRCGHSRISNSPGVVCVSLRQRQAQELPISTHSRQTGWESFRCENRGKNKTSESANHKYIRE